ncbi:Uncharacterised protein [uncultured archaeon]|nr:Uncharacterised protein [uncultured archaeon]
MKFLKKDCTNSPGQKSQAALEYMMVASIALLMLVPVVLDGWQSTAQLGTNINFQKARSAASQMADAAKTVYFQGTPSVMTINVAFPENIILANVSGKELYFKMKIKDSSTDIVEFFDFNVTGNLSNVSGMHEIYLEALPNVVNITQVS